MRRTALAAALAACGLLCGTAAAQTPATGTLAYNTGVYKGKPVLWAANLDGSNAHVLAKGGIDPRVSPDGTQVAYVVGFAHAKLRVIPAAGGTPRTVATNVWNDDLIQWSADSTELAVATGPENGPYTLKLVDLASSRTRKLATGSFYGVSFAPDGSGLVWSRGAKDTYPQRADLYKTDLNGGPVAALTTDHNALSPVWGPARIAYSRQHKPRKKNDAYKLDVYTINADGSGRERLTTTNPPFLLAGLTPLGWSADGNRLLAEYGGQDTSEAWRVDATTGTAKDVTGKFDGVIGYALSSDGTTILGRTGYFDDPNGNVVAIDYATGRSTILARRASSASWNR